MWLAKLCRSKCGCTRLNSPCRCASWRRRSCTARDVIGPTPSGPLYADFNLLVSSVLSGLGIGLCPTALISDHLAAGTLTVLGGLSMVSLLIGIAFWFMNAPWVLFFSGVEVLAVGVAFVVHARHATDRERIERRRAQGRRPGSRRNQRRSGAADPAAGRRARGTVQVVHHAGALGPAPREEAAEGTPGLRTGGVAGDDELLRDIRDGWDGILIVNKPGRARENIGDDIRSGLADLEAYGQMVLANPDFVERLKQDMPFNTADRNTFFGGAAQGYTDYPLANVAG